MAVPFLKAATDQQTCVNSRHGRLSSSSSSFLTSMHFPREEVAGYPHHLRSTGRRGQGRAGIRYSRRRSSFLQSCAGSQPLRLRSAPRPLSSTSTCMTALDAGAATLLAGEIFGQVGGGRRE
eukprot:713489-Hanusia_phi.AAC.1